MEGRLPHDAKRIAIWLPNLGRTSNVASSPAIWSQEIFLHLQGDTGGFPGDSFQFLGFCTLFFMRQNSYEICNLNFAFGIEMQQIFHFARE
jgi:hypothetical protein